LRTIRPIVRDFKHHNQMMLGVDGDLNIVADDAGAATARRHRAAVRVAQRDLLVGRGNHLTLINGKFAHRLLHLRELLSESRHFRGQRFRGLLPVGRVELAPLTAS
jgi:hypothetical protein